MSVNQYFKNDHVLMVMAHCDDELICGWPILQEPLVKKSVLIAASDRAHENRTWCSHRSTATEDVCRKMGVPCHVLPLNSEFSKQTHRGGCGARLEKQILKAIDKLECTKIFTHNPWGEYGHSDHKYLFDLLFRCTDTELIYSDQVLNSDWTLNLPHSARYQQAHRRTQIAVAELDETFYRKVQRLYEVRGVWTWNQPPPSQAALYKV